MKFVFCLLLIIFVIITSFSIYAYSEENLFELNEKAIQLITEKKYDEALSVANQMLLLDNDSFDGLYNKAKSLMGLQRFSESVEVFELILEKHDVVTNKALYNYAVSLSRVERYDDAIEYFDFILSDDDLFLPSLNQKAFALIKLEKFELALKILDEILQIDEENLQALTNKANALSKMGLNDEALDTINLALEKDQSNVLALVNKAIIFHDQGDSVLALDILNQALEIESTNLLALSEKTMILIELGRYIEAHSTSDQILIIDSRNMDGLNFKGSIYFLQGNYEEALRFFDKVLEIDASNTSVLENKFLVLVNLNRNNEAFVVTNEILQIDPANENALKNKELLIEQINIQVTEANQRTQTAIVVIIVATISLLFTTAIYFIKKFPTVRSKAKIEIGILLLIWWALVFLAVFFIDMREDMSFLDVNRHDVTNWATLIISLGIGVSVAYSIYLYSHVKVQEMNVKVSNIEHVQERIEHGQVKMDQLVTKADSILTHQALDSERRKKSAKFRLSSELNKTEEWLSRVNQLVKNCKTQIQKENVDKENYKENTLLWLKIPDSMRRESIRTLENLVEFYSEVFDDSQIEKIKLLIELSKTFYIPGTDRHEGKPITFSNEGTPEFTKTISYLRNSL